jgi:tetratricopeptide (TPR) repeat protein
MRCKACTRTTAPSQTKNFFGVDFCTRCYDALNLKDLEKKEVSGYLLTLSNESTKQLFDALTSIASKFDKKEQEALLIECIRVLGDESTVPEDILTVLLAVAALEESDGSEPLTTAGQMTLLNISNRLASELVKAGHELLSLPDGLSNYEMLRKGSELFKKDYALCMDVLDSIEPSRLTELIKVHLTELQKMCDLAFATPEMTLSAVKEGLYLECSEELTDVLTDEFGTEHVFQGWSHLKDTFKGLEEDFKDEGIILTIAEEEFNAPLYLLINPGELYLTTEWENLKKVIKSDDITTFAVIQENIPLFVLERVAGGNEPLTEFVKNALSEDPHNTDLILLYIFLLREQEKIEEALQFLQEKCSEIPENPQLLSELADLTEEMGELEQTLTVCEKIIAIEPENWKVILNMGRLHETLNEFSKAREFYEKALSLGGPPSYLVNLINRVDTAIALTALEELIAKEEYEKALEIVEKHFDPFEITIYHYYKGLILSRMGTPKEALEVMKDYLDIFSEDEEGWLEEAGIHLGLGQYMAAARCFRRCFNLNPDDIKPLVLEALCHKRLGRSRNYKRCINEAKKIDPEGAKELLKEFRF